MNRNPVNHFAEVEQAAFGPGNLPPGLGVSPDKVLQARLQAYPDAHRYRIGVNHTGLDVNRPRCPVHTYQRDGQTRFDGNGGGAPVYQPNSFDGPVDDAGVAEPPLRIDGDADHYDHRRDNDDYTQAGDLYRLMDAAAKQPLVGNHRSKSWRLQLIQPDVQLAFTTDSVAYSKLSHWAGGVPVAGALRSAILAASSGWKPLLP